MSPQRPEDEERDDVISVIGLEESEDRISLKLPREWRMGRGRVSAHVLRERMAAFMESLESVFEGLPQSYAGFNLDSITVSAEVSAKGQLSLLGSGGELSGKSGLTFVFKRDGGGGVVLQKPEAARPAD